MVAKGKLVFNHEVKNHSDYFVVIGNGSDLISQHKTLDDAEKALEKINIADSKWGVVRILEPNETWKVDSLERYLYDEQDFDWDLNKLFDK